MGCRLRQHGKGQRQPAGAIDAQNGEIGPPAKPGLDIAAQDGAERRRQRHGGAHVGENAGGTLAPMNVAHDGAADHRPGAGAQRLEQAGGDQCGNAGGEAQAMLAAT